jgi:hypothetical protein
VSEPPGCISPHHPHPHPSTQQQQPLPRHTQAPPPAAAPDAVHTWDLMVQANRQQRLAQLLASATPQRIRITPVWQLDESDYLADAGPGEGLAGGSRRRPPAARLWVLDARTCSDTAGLRQLPPGGCGSHRGAPCDALALSMGSELLLPCRCHPLPEGGAGPCGHQSNPEICAGKPSRPRLQRPPRLWGGGCAGML